MALKLHIPEVLDNPIMMAESRPQRILESLAEVHELTPLDLATHIAGELELLNRQKLAINTRVQALETYRPAVLANIESLTYHYQDASLPLPNQAQLAASAVALLWQELGYGYKIALIDLQNQLIKLGAEKNTVLVILRAMHAASEHAMVYYQTYFVVPTKIWADIHQLYFCAVQMGLQHIKVAFKPMDDTVLFKDAHLLTSIESTYKHAMLMHLADPQHLTQMDIRLTANYLAYYADHAKISAIAPQNAENAAFIINLNSNTPPVPCVKLRRAFNPNTDIVLNTIDLVRAVHQQLEALKNNQLPRNGSLPANANVSAYVDLLTYLIKHLGITPKRMFNRSPENGEIALVTGITATHALLSHQKTVFQEKSALASNRDLSAIKNSTPSRWTILNVSASGLSLRRHPTAEKNIKVRHLVSVKTIGASHWALGIIRWANCAPNDKLEIGIQLIAPSAESVLLRMDEREVLEPALLLPEMVTVQQVASLIAPSGTFAPARQVILIQDDVHQTIMLTKLVERSLHFERIQFSRIANDVSAKSS